MTIRRSILRETVLFVGAVIAALSFGAFVITDRVTRSGLEDLFEQRLERASVVLTEYGKAHHLARSKEIETILTSPRFLAAIETADPETVSQEIPTHAAILGSDFVVIEDAAGTLLYASNDLPPEQLARIRASFADLGETVEVVTIASGPDVVELVLARIDANNGAPLGRIASGSGVSAPYSNDLERLTGFEVLLTSDGVVVGHSSSDVLADFAPGSPDPIQFGEGHIEHVTIGGRDLLAYRAAEETTGLLVTFLGPLDEAIRPITTKIRALLLLLAIGGAALALGLLGAFTSRRVGRQVAALVGHAERIAREDLDFTIEATSKDEFGALAVEMETMRARLKSGRAELERAHAGQVNAERMAALGRVAAGIIHDFKNPMAVIRGTAELLERRDPSNEKLRKQSETIRNQVDRMASLTRDVLEYASGKSFLEPETIELGAYLREICEAHLEPFSRAGVALQVEDGPPTHLLLDPNRVRRVLDNVVVNAREVCRVGDRVQLRWSSKPGEGVRIEVSDEGPGIPAELLDRIFEPFVTSGKEGGTGLGLAIAKKILEDHGGQLEARNLDGRGARFTLVFPEKLRTRESSPVAEESFV